MSSISSFGPKLNSIQAIQPQQAIGHTPKPEPEISTTEAIKPTAKHSEPIQTTATQITQSLQRSVSNSIATGGLKETKVESLKDLSTGIKDLSNKDLQKKTDTRINSLVTKFGPPPEKTTFKQKISNFFSNSWKDIKGAFTIKSIKGAVEGDWGKLGAKGKAYAYGSLGAKLAVAGSKLVAFIKNSEVLKKVTGVISGAFSIVTGTIDTIKSFFSLNKTKKIKANATQFLKDPGAAQIKKAETKIEALKAKLSGASETDKPGIQAKITKLENKIETLKTPEGKQGLNESDSTQILKQVQKRQGVWNKVLNIGKNILGVVASAIGIAVTLGALATPVGWIATGVAVAGTLALAAYKYFKSSGREKVEQKLEKQENDLGQVKEKVTKNKTEFQTKLTELDNKIKADPKSVTPQMHIDRENCKIGIENCDGNLKSVDELTKQVKTQRLLKSPKLAKQFIMEKLMSKQETPQAQMDRKQAKLIARDVLGIKEDHIKNLNSPDQNLRKKATDFIQSKLDTRIKIFT